MMFSLLQRLSRYQPTARSASRRTHDVEYDQERTSLFAVRQTTCQLSTFRYYNPHPVWYLDPDSKVFARLR